MNTLHVRSRELVDKQIDSMYVGRGHRWKRERALGTTGFARLRGSVYTTLTEQRAGRSALWLPNIRDVQGTIRRRVNPTLSLRGTIRRVEYSVFAWSITIRRVEYSVFAWYITIRRV